LIAWGEKDPWEPVALGRAYGDFDTVEEFVVFPNVGHCPQVSSQSKFSVAVLPLCLAMSFVNATAFVHFECSNKVMTPFQLNWNPLVEQFVARHAS
jgi:hypothetical protein